MRITLNLDDEALRELARRRRLQEFLEFEGKMHWEGDLNQLRGQGETP